MAKACHTQIKRARDPKSSQCMQETVSNSRQCLGQAALASRSRLRVLFVCDLLCDRKLILYNFTSVRTKKVWNTFQEFQGVRVRTEYGVSAGE